MTPEIAARLESLDIQLMVEARAYSLFARGDLVAMAHRSGDGRFASLGSSAMMTDNGLAYLVWREAGPVLAAHGGNQMPATAEQVENLRRFSADLKAALELGE